VVIKNTANPEIMPNNDISSFMKNKKAASMDGYSCCQL
jgi:N-acetylmuramoyl-L-alanine amidase CwlA